MILFNVSVIFPVKPTRPSAEPFPDALRRAGPRAGGGSGQAGTAAWQRAAAPAWAVIGLIYLHFSDGEGA